MVFAVKLLKMYKKGEEKISGCVLMSYRWKENPKQSVWRHTNDFIPVPVNVFILINTEKHEWALRQGNLAARKLKEKKHKSRQGDRKKDFSTTMGNVTQMASHCDDV